MFTSTDPMTAEMTSPIHLHLAESGFTKPAIERRGRLWLIVSGAKHVECIQDGPCSDLSRRKLRIIGCMVDDRHCVTQTAPDHRNLREHCTYRKHPRHESFDHAQKSLWIHALRDRPQPVLRPEVIEHDGGIDINGDFSAGLELFRQRHESAADIRSMLQHSEAIHKIEGTATKR